MDAENIYLHFPYSNEVTLLTSWEKQCSSHMCWINIECTVILNILTNVQHKISWPIWN